jgi:hypothetical protein
MFSTIPFKGANTIKGTKGAKVKVLFQGLHVTCGIHVLVYYLIYKKIHTQLPLHVIDIILLLLCFDPISCTHFCSLPHKNE